MAKHELRYFQKAACNAAVKSWRRGQQFPMMSIFTALGKALIAAALSNWCLKQKHVDENGNEYLPRVLNLVPSKNLTKQNFQEAYNYIDNPNDLGVVCVKLNKKQYHKRCVIAMYQSLANNVYIAGKFDYVIVDECFTKNTKVLTPKGWININFVRSGDYVYNAFGIGKVTATSVKPAHEIYTLELNNGQRIECTGNHPFFTERGWKKAAELVEGENFFSIEAVRFMFKDILSCHKKRQYRKDNQLRIRITLGKGKFLLKRMLLERKREQLSSNNRINTEALQVLRKNVQTLDRERLIWKSNRLSKQNSVGQARMLFKLLCSEIETCIRGRDQKNESDNDPKRTPSNSKRREWSTIITTAISAFTRARGWMESGISNKNTCRTQERSLSELLQSGHRKHSLEDSDRNTGEFTRNARETGAGQEEKRKACVIRVVGISIEQRESPEPVYNLSVSGHPSFFADGVLVHNCHDVSNNSDSRYRKMFRQILRINPKCKFLGITATHWRLGQGLLTDKCVKGDSFFKEIVYNTYEDPGIQKLIDEGYLAQIETLNTNIQMDLTGVKMSGNDYNQEEVGVKFDAICIDAVEDMRRHVKEREIETALVFVSNGANARKVIEQWGDDSTIRMVSDSLSDSQNTANFKWLEKGHGRRILANVQMATTGYNFPALQAIFIMTASTSSSKIIQIVGRLVRPFGDKVGMVADYGTNFLRLGGIHDIQIPKQKLKKSDAPKKSCLLCYTLNILSAKVCVNPECRAEFISTDKTGKYRMVSPAEAMKLKLDQKIITVPVQRYEFEKKENKLGRPYLSLKFIGFDGRIIHQDYLALSSESRLSTQAQAVVMQLYKSVKDFYELGEDGLNADLLIKFFDEYEEEYFKRVESIAIRPKDGGGKYKNRVGWVLK